MYYSSVLLLLCLFVAVVTSQTAECIAARNAVQADATCYSAFLNVGDAIDNYRSISRSDLNAYCVPDCRNLINRVIPACDNDTSSAEAVGFNEFVCSIGNDGFSCYDFINSARYDALTTAIDRVCPNISEQTCSSTCQTAFQKFVVDAGCCFVEFVEFNRQDANSVLLEILAQCPVDLSPGGTCVEIGGSGGANGLKPFGSVLFLAVIIALTGYYI